MSFALLRTALKIALRETRAAPAKFLFVIFAVALGVGVITGVRGFSIAFRQRLLDDARLLMGADASVRLFAALTPQQQQILELYRRRGVDTTIVLETLSMAASAPGNRPVLVTVKAVDVSRFPFYGSLGLSPPLSQPLSPQQALASDDLLSRLKLQPGDHIRLGNADFRIAARITYEPDRLSGSFSIGPRLLISHQGLDRAGLIQLGSRATRRILFKLPPAGMRIEELSDGLRRAFPEGFQTDYRQINPRIARSLRQATVFLSMIGLIALIVGAAGVAMAIHAHLQQRLNDVAVMKCLGATSHRVLIIYSLQTALLGLAGGLLGVLLGLAIQNAFPALLTQFIPIAFQPSWTPSVALQGLATAVLTTLLLTLPPLIRASRVRPSLILRRQVTPPPPSWPNRLANLWRPALAAALISAGLAAVAFWLIHDSTSDGPRVAAYFTTGVLLALLALAALARLLLVACRRVIRLLGPHLSPALRHGIANLYRPGSQSAAVIAVLGLGVMFILSAHLIQRSLLADLNHFTPRHIGNLFLLDITPALRPALERLLTSLPQVQSAPEFLPTIPARLLSAAGRSDFRGRYRPQRSITTAHRLPPGLTVIEGQWFQNPSTPQVSVAEEAARAIGLHPGDWVEWETYGRRIRAQVAAVHQADPARLISLLDFILTPDALRGLPVIYYGAVRAAPGQSAAVQHALFEHFPTVTAVSIADIVERAEDIADRIALVVRILSAFIILAGAIILASSVAATRFQRIQEIAVLKALGATRRRVARALSTEFLLLGSASGLLAVALAAAFSAWLLHQLLNTRLWFDWPAALLAVFGAAFLAAASGCLASFDLLKRKPLEVLRDE
jgi:putative ABC transport system permease protein